jgi:hypothetical protein
MQDFLAVHSWISYDSQVFTPNDYGNYIFQSDSKRCLFVMSTGQSCGERDVAGELSAVA